MAKKTDKSDGMDYADPNATLEKMFPESVGMLGKAPPIYKRDGTVNHAHFSFMYNALIRTNVVRISAGKGGLPGLESMVKMLTANYEMLGGRLEDVVNQQSDEQRAAQNMAKLLEAPGAMLEMTESELSTLEREFDKIILLGKEYLIGKVEAAASSEGATSITLGGGK